MSAVAHLELVFSRPETTLSVTRGAARVEREQFSGGVARLQRGLALGLFPLLRAKRMQRCGVRVGAGVPVSTVSHAVYPVAPHLKTALLMKLLDKTDAGSVLVFTRTKHRTTRVAEQMQRAEIDYLLSSPAGQTMFAENYVGLPF